jgi:hypothetical protein
VHKFARIIVLDMHFGLEIKKFTAANANAAAGEGGNQVHGTGFNCRVIRRQVSRGKLKSPTRTLRRQFSSNLPDVTLE